MTDAHWAYLGPLNTETLLPVEVHALTLRGRDGLPFTTAPRMRSGALGFELSGESKTCDYYNYNQP